MSGVVLYRGPSFFDAAPIVVIATDRTVNRKTGPMIQTWILREDISPVDAVKTGQDASVCGSCVHRGDGRGKQRTCYVVVYQAPGQVWRTYQRGMYPPWTPGFGHGRLWRVGAYGDPAAVPLSVWNTHLKGALGWTGYTHSWRLANPGLQRYCMASCDSLVERDEAKAAGWRTFRVSGGNDTLRVAGEAVCPASAEADYKTNCSACRACNGTATNRRSDITIQAHGGPSVMSAIAKRYHPTLPGMEALR